MFGSCKAAIDRSAFVTFTARFHKSKSSHAMATRQTLVTTEAASEGFARARTILTKSVS